MPIPTRAGVLAAGASGSALVIEHHYIAAGASQVVSFAGAATGNLAVIIINSATGSGIPAGWTLVGTYTWPSLGRLDVVCSKVLTGGDIGTGSVTVTTTANNRTVSALFYAGATAAALVSAAESSLAQQIALPGFTKNAACKAIIGYTCDASNQPAPLAPGTMTSIIAVYGNPAAILSRVDGIFNPSNYVNGSVLTYTAVGSTVVLGAAIAQLIELT